MPSDLLTKRRIACTDPTAPCGARPCAWPPASPSRALPWPPTRSPPTPLPMPSSQPGPRTPCPTPGPPPPAARRRHPTPARPARAGGAQELEVGVALPLWLPGQRSRSQALVTQEEQALDARLDSARLQLAGQVREAWWAWQRARAELALAGAQVEHAQALSQDVHRRVRAGDLAPADAHQADGALALAQSAQARAEGQSVQAWQALQGLLGSAQPWPSAAPSTPGPTGAEPTPCEVSADLAQHPLVRDLDQQAATARQPQQAQATLDGAQARWRAAQRAHEAAQRRATLAHETQAFFDKSFRLGETDLPTRLRIAQEAQEAARQASLAAIDLAAAASAWRQAAGLLPQ